MELYRDSSFTVAMSEWRAITLTAIHRMRNRVAIFCRQKGGEGKQALFADIVCEPSHAAVQSLRTKMCKSHHSHSCLPAWSKPPPVGLLQQISYSSYRNTKISHLLSGFRILDLLSELDHWLL